MPEFKTKSKYIPVSLDFIDNYMPQAHGEYVKVYLYGLAAAADGRKIDNESIAKNLHILVTDVENAWKYWSEKGFLTVTPDVIEFGVAEKENIQPPREDKPPHVTSRDIAAALNMNPNMKDTISMVEQLLGKPLTQREITAIFNFMDWYGMDGNLILMLFEYCISIDKKNFAYIEKVAQSWNKEGINDIKSAEAVIKRAREEKKFHGQCKKLFGIDRNFTSSELKYINSWKTDMGFSLDMVSQAYEITVKNTGKLAFAYMNKILMSWHQKGIKTPGQIQEKDVKPKSGDVKIGEQALIDMRRRMQQELE
ncbi:MAG: DnaD domain protein [Clostridia bacterium]